MSQTSKTRRRLKREYTRAFNAYTAGTTFESVVARASKRLMGFSYHVKSRRRVIHEYDASTLTLHIGEEQVYP